MQDGAHVEPAIEAVLELGEVAVGVLGKTEGMVGPADRGLQVAQQRVDGLELRQLHARPATAGDDALVGGADQGSGAEAPQSIGEHGGRSRDVRGSEHG